MTQEDRNAWETEQARALTEASERIAFLRHEITQLKNGRPLEDAAKTISQIVGKPARVQRTDDTTYANGKIVVHVEYAAHWRNELGEHTWEDAPSLAALIDLVRAKHNARNAKDDHPELSGV